MVYASLPGKLVFLSNTCSKVWKIGANIGKTRAPSMELHFGGPAGGEAPGKALRHAK